ncbi:MAG: nuclease [Desulfovibrio sp.]|nr:nuclease [Desulfovibrio sp.]
MRYIAVSLIALALFAAYVQAREPGPELAATVVRVVDGDTVKVRLLGEMPDFFRVQSIRLRHCDTPELREKRPEIAAKAREARAFVKARIAPGMRLTLTDVGRDKYGGRLVADIVVAGEDLCRSLLDAGLAVPYEGGRKTW